MKQKIVTKLLNFNLYIQSIKLHNSAFVKRQDEGEIRLNNRKKRGWDRMG